MCHGAWCGFKSKATKTGWQSKEAEASLTGQLKVYKRCLTRDNTASVFACDLVVPNWKTLNKSFNLLDPPFSLLWSEKKLLKNTVQNLQLRGGGGGGGWGVGGCMCISNPSQMFGWDPAPPIPNPVLSESPPRVGSSSEQLKTSLTGYLRPSP